MRSINFSSGSVIAGNARASVCSVEHSAARYRTVTACRYKQGDREFRAGASGPHGPPLSHELTRH
jgi:hypothetical protein